MRLVFPYSFVQPLDLPDSSLLGVLKPLERPERTQSDRELIIRAIANPIGAPRIGEMARGKRSILVLVDDYTRTTPVHSILPEVLAELRSSGIRKKDIRILIASGTHRPMTREEKERRFGAEVMTEYSVLDHRHDDYGQLRQLPTTKLGTEVWVNKAVTESDFVIGIGHIVPHRVAGFSGGGKIVQPGVCGAITTGQTHWLSAKFDGAQIMGKIDNPVRDEIDKVANTAGLSYIVNAILDGKGKIADLVCGHPVEAFRAGAVMAREIYGISLEEPADIVVADAFPTDMEMWQASKGIYASDLALKKGGVLILVTPCAEGVSAEFPQLSRIGYKTYHEVEAMLGSGELTDLTLAAHLVHVGRVVREKARCILVSAGIDAETTARLGFTYARTPQEALTIARQIKGEGASIVALQNGGEIMPIVRNPAYGV
jgi:nickel-dependent lactate racemase